LGKVIKIKIFAGGEQILSLRLNAPEEIEVEVEGEGTKEEKKTVVEKREDITIKKEVIPGIPEAEIEEEKEEVSEKKSEPIEKEEKHEEELFRDVIEGSTPPKEEVTNKDAGGEKVKDEALKEFFNENESEAVELKKQLTEKPKGQREQEIKKILNDLLGM